MLVLWVQNNQGIDQEFPVSEEMRIGRQAGNTLQLADSLVSGEHALIQVRPDGVWLIDLGSTNGTWMNGACLLAHTPYQLALGQQIVIGSATLQLVETAQPQPPVSYAAYPTPGMQPGQAPAGYAPTYAPAQKKRFPLLPVLFGVGVLVVFLGVIGLLVIIGGRSGTPSVASNTSTIVPTDFPPEQLPPLVALTQQSSTAVSVDGQIVTDANNVSASIPQGSVQGADVVHLLAYQPPAAFDADLAQNGWQRLSPLYTLALDGESENVGGAELSFPANTPEDQLALLLDDRFVVPVPDTAQAGRLTVQTSVKPGSGEPVVEGGGTHYFVISPISQTSALPGASLATNVLVPDSLAASGFALAALPSIELQTEPALTNSTGEITCYEWTSGYTDCYDNSPLNKRSENTLVVIVPQSLKAHPELKAPLQQFIGTLMDQVYAYSNTLHLNNVPSPLPKHSKAIVRIANWATNPQIDPTDWNIYINMKVVLGLGTDLALHLEDQCALAHELFHWIEGKSYGNWMKNFFQSGSFRWEMEMRADVGSFLINPACQVVQLTRKGKTTDDSTKRLGWQQNLFDWDVSPILRRFEDDDEHYVQAQIARMGLCPDTSKCIYSLQEFIDDVNNGTSNWSIEGFRRSLENVASYLLGNNSLYTEGAYPRNNEPVLQNGWDFGDYIWAGLQGKTNLPEILPYTTKQVDGQTGEVTIDTVVASGAIYPLRVSNGASTPSNVASRKPDGPYRLTIKAGIPFYYVEGNQGGVQFWDGKTAKIFEPITSVDTVFVQGQDGKWQKQPGLSSVRLVAVNPNADRAPLKATFAPLAPMVTVNPEPITIPDLNTPVKIEINVAQIFANVKSFNVSINYNDGSAPVSLPTTVGADGTAKVIDTHTFQKADMKSVVVSFNSDGTAPLNWPALQVPVGGNTNSFSYTHVGGSIVHVFDVDPYRFISDASNFNCPIQWTGPTSFESQPGCNDASGMAQGIKLSGSINGDSATIDVVLPDLMGCPHAYSLVNIPMKDSGPSTAGYQFSGAVEKVVKYIVNFKSLDAGVGNQDGSYPDKQCYSGINLDPDYPEGSVIIDFWK